MTGLLPNWWAPMYYSTKCPIIPPTGKKMGGGWRSSTPSISPVKITSRIRWMVLIKGGIIILVLSRFGTKIGGLHKNLLPFALLPRVTPYTPGPMGGRQYLSLLLNFYRKLSLGMLENNLDDEGVSINYPICLKKRSIGPGRPGNELVVVLPTPECEIGGIMCGLKRRHNMWKLSVLPAKVISEPIPTAIIRFLHISKCITTN